MTFGVGAVVYVIKLVVVPPYTNTYLVAKVPSKSVQSFQSQNETKRQILEKHRRVWNVCCFNFYKQQVVNYFAKNGSKQLYRISSSQLQEFIIINYLKYQGFEFLVTKLYTFLNYVTDQAAGYLVWMTLFPCNFFRNSQVLVASLILSRDIQLLLITCSFIRLLIDRVSHLTLVTFMFGLLEARPTTHVFVEMQ